MDTFAQTFLKIYDRKLLNGETVFSRSGINKEDFTRLCVDKDYIIPHERLEIIFDKMNLSEDEKASLEVFY